MELRRDHLNITRGTPGEDLHDWKGSTTIAVCVPARDEATTIGEIVRACAAMARDGLIDELLVVDDHSTDDTAAIAAGAGAKVCTNDLEAGKGEAIRNAVDHTSAELLVFLDADVTNFSPAFVTRLLGPLFLDQGVQLVKATYARGLGGQPGEGGRVTEILAKPLLERFFPALAHLEQPLAGECALRRSALEGIVLSPRYGIEIGLLIDLARAFGAESIAEVDLGERVHRNRPLHELGGHSRDILDAVLSRIGASSADALHHPALGGNGSDLRR